MNANIVVKLNDGRSYVYGNVDIEHLRFPEGWLCLKPNENWRVEDVKEVHIKMMPVLTQMENIAYNVLGLHRHD